MYNGRENLRHHYVTVYGPETANKIRRLECLKTKRARHLTSLTFLKRCRDTNIIPICVQIAPKKDISGSASILRQASKKLLVRRIRQHRFDTDNISKDIDSLSAELISILTTLDYQKCQECTDNRASIIYDEYKDRQIRKYNKLSEKRTPPRHAESNSLNKTSVVNLCKSTSIEPVAIEALENGLNYAIAPRKVPYEQIICSVEDVLAKNNIKKEDLEAMRQDVSAVLRHSKPPKPNLPKNQYLALNNLRKNQDVIILRADKGNSTVILDTAEYNLKIQDLLSDVTTYKQVKTDPTNKILTKTKELITKHSEKLGLDLQALVPSCPKPPKLYGLPKIHKEGHPLRPIVSQIDSPTYKLAQHLSKILSKLRGNTDTYVRDSYHFISQIKDLRLTDEELMVSFDVQSLFTNLPLYDCIEIVKKKLRDNNLSPEYAELLEHCLTSGYLYWENNFYMQINGVAMGSPVSPVVADIYMEDFEKKALATALATPKTFKRYVDDTFVIISQQHLSAFLTHLNSINNKIQFTMELESNKSLAFLDILLTRNPDNSISHTVYRKPTHTDKYLNGNSHHHPSQLSTIGKTLFQRAQGICDAKHLEKELRHVKTVLRSNNLKPPRPQHRKRPKNPTVERLPAILPYIKGITDKIGNILRRASIKTYFKPHKKISQYLRPIKSHIPFQDAGVYKLDCECGLSYIGQTKRSIGTRIKEHIADIKHNRSNKSALCEHISNKTNHYIHFDRPQILAKENYYIPRLLREAIEIKKHPNFNRDDGWQVPPAWDPVIKIIKSQSKHKYARPQDTVSDFCVNRNRYT